MLRLCRLIFRQRGLEAEIERWVVKNQKPSSAGAERPWREGTHEMGHRGGASGGELESRVRSFYLVQMVTRSH